MPVLVNNETGYAENLTPEQESLAIKQGTHGVPVYNLNNEAEIAPHADLPNLLANGYRLPNDKEYKHALSFGKAAQEPGKAFLEATGSGASFGLSRVLGNSEEQLARKEANPVANVLGNLTGLTATAATGFGAGAVMARAGAVGAAAIGLGEASVAARVGTAAAKMAIENAVFAAGDEVDKKILGDPNQTVGSAVADIGAAAVFGGVLGAAGKGTTELWNATAGKQVTKLLDAVKNKANGVPSEIKNAAGLDLVPEMNAVLGDSPAAKHAYQSLMESNTATGEHMQKIASDFHAATDSAIRETVGSPVSLDPEALGEGLKKQLVSRIQEVADPISVKYNKINDNFGQIGLDISDKATIADNIVKISDEQGWAKMPDGKGNQLTQKVLNHIELQESANDLRKYASNLKKENPFGSEGYDSAKRLANALENHIDTAIEKNIGFKAPEIMAEYKATKAEYGQMKNMFEELNDRLRSGRQHGEVSFSKNISEMQAEDVVKRLSPKGDAAFAKLLEGTFPDVAASIKQIELNKLVNKATVGETINAGKLFKQISELKKENGAYLDFILKPEQMSRLEGLAKLMDRLPKKMNNSGTAKTLDAMWSGIPAGAGAFAGAITGHNPALAGVMAMLTGSVAKGAPDKVRMALLKYLGSDLATSASAFKSTVSHIESIVAGEAKINKAAKSVFDTGAKVITLPSAQQTEKLLKLVARNENGKPWEMDSELGHYMPEHASTAAMQSQRVMQYLSQQRPGQKFNAPLDKQHKPSATENARYMEAVHIAEQPAIILNAVKDGSLTPSMVHHLQAMYPELYSSFVEKLTAQMTDAKAKGVNIPFKTVMSLSLFLNQPLVTTLTQPAIAAAQPIPTQQNAPTPPQMGVTSKLNKLSRMPGNYATPLQNREINRR